MGNSIITLHLLELYLEVSNIYMLYELTLDPLHVKPIILLIQFRVLIRGDTLGQVKIVYFGFIFSAKTTSYYVFIFPTI